MGVNLNPHVNVSFGLMTKWTIRQNKAETVVFQLMIPGWSLEDVVGLVPHQNKMSCQETNLQ